MTAEEVDPLLAPAQVDPPRLTRMQLQLELAEELPHTALGFPTVLLRLAEHDEVVAVAHQHTEIGAPLAPHVVEKPQVDVRQQRRDHPALRRTAELGRLEPVFHPPGFEPLSDQLQNPTIRDLASHQRQAHRVVDLPEKVADVPVQHMVEAPVHGHPDLLQRLRRRAAGPKPIRAVPEPDLEDRFQDLLRCRLHDPVSHRRNPERSLLAIGLRNVPAQDRLRLVRVLAQFGLDRFEEALHSVLLNRRDRLGIDARGPMVPSHLVPRLLQDVTPADAVVQRVKLSTRLLLGHIPQPTLEASYVVLGTSPSGGVGTLRVHALARTPSIGSTSTPGTLPSGRVVLHGLRRWCGRYYGPLGLPLRGARLRLGLIRSTWP